MDKSRNMMLDVIKGYSIIAIVLYHFGGGIMPFGYLCVDTFLVISGYLLGKSIIPAIKDSSFNYFRYIIKRINRLLPLALIATGVALFVGYFVMLPDDYENLSESAIASVTFTNNILESITTKNYWRIENQYKPLMHFWYIGVLFQSYISIPLFFLIAKRIFSKRKYFTLCASFIGIVISLVLYLLPTFSITTKFYHIPFRIFELLSGCVAADLSIKLSERIKLILCNGSLLAIVLLSLTRQTFISNEFMVLSMVIMTFILILNSNVRLTNPIVYKSLALFSCIGEKSYSFFVWHQIIAAFLFYVVFEYKTIPCFVVYLAITILVSLLSYSFLEKNISSNISKGYTEKKCIFYCILSACAVLVYSGFIYLNAGVVRDIPELDIYTTSVHRNMHSEYCDRPYQWTHPFKTDSECKILVVGNSYARDWANVLYEYDNTLDINYQYYAGSDIAINEELIDDSDFIFFAYGPGIGMLPRFIFEKFPRNKLYIVGNKRYGFSNGIYYNRRFYANYYDQTVSVPDDLIQNISYYSRVYEDHYIDLMHPIMNEEGRAHIFTDDNRFISQDGMHLTKGGAQYYSRILNIQEILNRRYLPDNLDGK